MTQRSPCYSAVSSSLMDHLPYCYNYSPLFTILPHPLLHSPDQYFTSLFGRPLPSCSSGDYYFTAAAKSSRELMSSEEYRSALRKLNNKQRQVVMFLLLIFKLSSQFPFVSFSFLSISILSLCSLSQFFPFSLSPSLSTTHSFSSDQFSVL